MKMYRLIDENGFFIEDVINPQIEEGQEQFYIEEPVPQGFYHPKWSGSEWVEGMPQEQIEELKSQPVELSPEQEELKVMKRRLDETENALLQAIDMILMGGM